MEKIASISHYLEITYFLYRTRKYIMMDKKVFGPRCSSIVEKFDQLLVQLNQEDDFKKFNFASLFEYPYVKNNIVVPNIVTNIPRPLLDIIYQYASPTDEEIICRLLSEADSNRLNGKFCV